MSDICTQVVVYEIVPDKVDEFLGVKDQLVTEAKTLPGLINSATFRSDGQPNLFIDRMEWESAEAARAGNERFEQLPTTGLFFSLMAGPPRLAGEFSLIAGA